MLRKLLKAGAWVSAGIFIGRLSGFGREFLIARAYGVSGQADAAILALTAPDLVLNLIAGGAIGFVLIPEFKRLGAQGAGRGFAQASLLTALAFAAVTLPVSLASGALVAALAPGFNAGDAETAASLIRVILWSVPLTALAGASTAYLQAMDRFAVAAFGTLLFNGTLIAYLTGYLGRGGLEGLGLAAIAGAGLRWVSQLADARAGRPAKSRWVFSPWVLERGLGVRYFQAMAAGGLLFLLPVIARQAASFGTPGSVALLNYALKLVELPLGAALSVIPVVLFPKLSELYAGAASAAEGTRLARTGLRVILVTALALAISLCWLAHQLAHVPLESWRGLSAESLSKLFGLAAIGFLSVPAQGLTAFTTTIFNSRRHTAPPFYASLAGAGLFLPVAWSLQRTLGLEGVIYAFVGAHYFVLAIHFVLLAKTLRFDALGAITGRGALRGAMGCGLGFLPAAALGTLAQGAGGTLAAAIVGGGASLGAGLFALRRSGGGEP